MELLIAQQRATVRKTLEKRFEGKSGGKQLPGSGNHQRNDWPARN